MNLLILRCRVYLIIEYVRLCTSILLLVMYLSIGNTSDEQIFFINKYHSIILFNSYYNNTAISDQPTKYIIVSRSAVSCSLHYILINQVLLSWYHSLIVIDSKLDRAQLLTLHDRRRIDVNLA